VEHDRSLYIYVPIGKGITGTSMRPSAYLLDQWKKKTDLNPELYVIVENRKRLAVIIEIYQPGKAVDFPIGEWRLSVQQVIGL
jgi:hypothetical protein